MNNQNIRQNISNLKKIVKDLEKQIVIETIFLLISVGIMFIMTVILLLGFYENGALGLINIIIIIFLISSIEGKQQRIYDSKQEEFDKLLHTTMKSLNKKLGDKNVK